LKALRYESFEKDGMFRQFAEAFVTYFKPNFHPSDMDDQALFDEFANLIDSRIAERGVEPHFPGGALLGERVAPKAGVKLNAFLRVKLPSKIEP
jgi:hypothetical protein